LGRQAAMPRNRMEPMRAGFSYRPDSASEGNYEGSGFRGPPSAVRSVGHPEILRT
jgi:hypothetical protein